jgi:acetyl-CoA carboxylase biotin carboxyl carrier protein
MSGLAASDVAYFAELLEREGWAWMRVRIDGTELELGRRPAGISDTLAGLPPSPAPATVAAAEVPAAGELAPAGGVPGLEEGLVEVTAPTLGVFYRAPAPGEQPFVSEGQTIAPGDEVGLLEVMKLYNSVISTVAGTVRRICVPDGEMVEAGQTLVLVAPA